MSMQEWLLKYWLEIAFGLATAAIGAGYARLKKALKKEREKNIAIENGLKGILRINIIDTYDKCISDGFITISRKDAICDVYRSYIALCASQDEVDDTITQMYEELRHLPVKRKE